MSSSSNNSAGFVEPIEFMQSRLAVLSHLISTSEHYLKDPLTLHLQAVKFLLSSSAGADESTEGTIPSSRKLTFVCDKEAFYELDEDGFYVFDPYLASITFSHKVIDIRIKPNSFKRPTRSECFSQVPSISP